ncbi:MAG: SUMF1/EgtB/PvdO family nonheme iron enzyme, partial [Magnetococcales bacterium]|nr:SUMF1/EgtB/PvdO family nonheme iron enzyme [Magnetococcales bacterium]
DGEQEGEDFWPLLKQQLDNPQWRETVELFPGTLFDEGGKRRVDKLLKRVLELRSPNPDLTEDARIAGIMGRLLQPMNAYHYKPPKEIDEIYQQVLNRATAIFTIDGARGKSISNRIESAEALGRGGDPRLSKENFAKPEYFIEVPGTGWRLRKFLVTVQEYQEFVEQEGYQESQWWDQAGWTTQKTEKWKSPYDWDEQLQHPTRPVVYVSWFEAMAYCRWLSDQKKLSLCLPSEELWQKAATSSTGEYPWGANKPTPELANFNKKVNSPTPVGLYPDGDGPLGHCDLAGNVWEWQIDSVPGEDRMVIRGGSWSDKGEALASAFRSYIKCDTRQETIGFRVASDLFP